MTDLQKVEEERFVESMVWLWVAHDAPEWIKDYVRQESRKQRGLLEEKQEAVAMPKEQEAEIEYTKPITPSGTDYEGINIE